jgi:radical SAM protein with 4Fe4S-binding SPASM domain
MLMNVQNRLSAGIRNDLGEALPLEQPYVLLLDPSSLCNLRCKWCPSGYDKLIAATGRSQKIMSFEMFERIVNQAAEFEKPFRVLRMYKEGEPLLNPHFADMIKLAKESGRFERIDTTTNGVLFNRELNRKIIDAGIDQINISVNGVSEEQIYKNTGRHVDFNEYVNNIKDLCENKGNCTVYIKSIQDVLSSEEQKKFFDIFGEMADRIFLERLSPAWPAFDVSDSGYICADIGNYNQPVENRQVCPYIFYIMVVNADGTVSTCVGDWKHHQLAGNINDESLKQIWLGEKQRRYQLEHLHKNKDCFEMCRECKVITHGCYDNIDAYATEIERKMLTG